MISINCEERVGLDWRSRRGIVVSVLLKCRSWSAVVELKWRGVVRAVW
jgi:hypothetical protein